MLALKTSCEREEVFQTLCDMGLDQIARWIMVLPEDPIGKVCFSRHGQRLRKMRLQQVSCFYINIRNDQHGLRSVHFLHRAFSLFTRGPSLQFGNIACEKPC